MSKERADYITRDFLEGRSPSMTVESTLKAVNAMVQSDPRLGDRVSWDSLLVLLLDCYAEMKAKVQRQLGISGPWVTLPEMQRALGKEPRWLEQQTQLVNEVGLEDGDKLRTESVLSALVDLRIYKCQTC